MMTTGVASLAALMRCSTSRPSMPGIFTSRKMRSGDSFSASATPSGPLEASMTSYPSYSRIIRTERRISASSSTTRIRDFTGLFNGDGDERSLSDRGIVNVQREDIAGFRGADQSLVVAHGSDRTPVDLHDHNPATEQRLEAGARGIDP